MELSSSCSSSIQIIRNANREPVFPEFRSGASRRSVSLGGNIENIDGVSWSSKLGIVIPFVVEVNGSNVLSKRLSDISFDIQIKEGEGGTNEDGDNENLSKIHQYKYKAIRRR